MTGRPVVDRDQEAELRSLIETIHAAELRIAELTGGQVDAIVDSTGSAHLLGAAQRRLRDAEVDQRMASRVLPSTTVRALAGLAPDAALPPPGTREELAIARTMTDRLADVLGPVVDALHPWTVDPPEHPRRLRRRLTWLLLRPGRLDRDE